MMNKYQPQMTLYKSLTILSSHSEIGSLAAFKSFWKNQTNFSRKKNELLLEIRTTEEEHELRISFKIINQNQESKSRIKIMNQNHESKLRIKLKSHNQESKFGVRRIRCLFRRYDKEYRSDHHSC